MNAQVSDVRNCENIYEVLERAHLNFNAVCQEVITMDGVPMPGYKGIYRSDNRQALSIMGEDYTPFSPVETFAIADELRKQNGLEYRRAYGIDGGKKIMIELGLPLHDGGTAWNGRKGLGHDEGELRIRIGDSLDGTKKFTCQAGIWRQVCSNGLFGWAKESAFSIRHTKGAHERLDESLRIWAKLDNAFESMAANVRKLQERIITHEQVERFLDSLIGEVKENTSSRIKNTREDIKHLFEHGKGNHGRTAWDLVNGVTEYYQHEVNPNNPDARLASAIYGIGQDRQSKAFELALTL